MTGDAKGLRPMNRNEVRYVGDGAYLKFTGWSFEFMANSHDYPTDRVSIDINDAQDVVNMLMGTLHELRPAGKERQDAGFN